MPPCAIEFFDRFAVDARALSPDRRRELDDALRRLSEAFGQPHLHSGLGIRRLKRDYFECRVGRDQRIAFKLKGRTLFMARIGSHDDVRRFIKGL
ncbi:MAG: hypothetical protein PHE83_06260 [Opitutaceae bacterium]|nr:hypothetical protein [Opitutaceae bacterium]